MTEGNNDRTLIGAVDQGTSSTRFLVFNKEGGVVAQHQLELKQQFPQQGWVEENPEEIVGSVLECITEVCLQLSAKDIPLSCIKSVGITNQRETLVVWDKASGTPLHNAIIWSDNRTAETVERLTKKCPNEDKYHFQKICGLPLSTYFTAVKLKWVMDNYSGIAEAVKSGTCCVGTVDTWLLWRLTGGSDGGKYATDVTNASRTMLMNLETLQWDLEMCQFFDIPIKILPQIRSSSEVYGKLQLTKLKGTPISGILGDQQAALVGQQCMKKGLAKNTYGTGCFLLFNTGTDPVFSKNGLLTTVAYKLGPSSPACFALEGAVAVAGAGVQWLRDNLGVLSHLSDIEPLARSVASSEGCHFVPAFSGLLCPYWEPDARGIISGLTQKTTKAHIARACLESVCFQTCEIVEAMNLDCGVPMTKLLVDGGMSGNQLMMQMQADTLGLTVQRPTMAETTALGAAMAAGLADGINVWKLDSLPLPKIDLFQPIISKDERQNKLALWKKAVRRSFSLT